jgi:hypothetical protein
MPIIKRKLSIASGATSDNVFANTTYQTVDPGTRLVIAAAVDTAGTAIADTTMDFNVNNAEFASDCSVSTLVTGEPFGWNNTGYVLNDMQTVGATNRPILTFKNGTSATRQVEVAVFVGG